MISIIIPTYNRAHLIVETIQSIQKQTYTNWECIVIDDGSSDNTALVMQEIITADDRFQFHKRPESLQKGVSICRNYGFSLAKGNYINFVDSDDILTPSHLAFHINNLTNNTISCSVSQAQNFIDEPTNLKALWSNNNHEQLLIEMANNSVLWAIGSVIWKKECLPTKPFREDLINSEEWLFHLDQIIKGVPYIISEKVTYLVRSHEQRAGKITSKNKVLSIFCARKYLIKSLQNNNLFTVTIERNIIKDVFFALRLSIEQHYFALSLKIIGYLFANFFTFRHKVKILKVIFVACPIYLITQKGERLFK